MAVLKKIKFGESKINNIAKTIVNGAPNGVIAVSNTANYENTDAEPKDYSYDIDVRVDDATIVKDGDTNKVLKVGTVPATQVSVADSAGVFTAENVETALKELKDDIAEVDGAAKSYKIVTVAEPASTSQAEYKIQEKIGDGNWADVTDSSAIIVPKDNAFVTAQLGHTGATVNQTTGAITDGPSTGAEVLLIEYKNGEGVYTLVEIPVGDFLRESEFKDGLAVSANGEVSAKLGQGLEFGGETDENQSIKVKIDTTSTGAENFLSVGANGVKISGVQDAINTSIGALDVTNDNAVAGQYVAAIEETDGVVAVKTRANVSDAVLTGYAKGTKPASTAIAATDDVKGAIAKLEHQIDDAKAAATTKVEKDANASHLTLTNATAADGSVTYTIGESDIASKTDLDAEIAARKAVDGQDGKTYVANASANYIGSATSLNDADVKLDAALKAVSDKANAIQYKVSGTTLEFFGMTEHA